MDMVTDLIHQVYILPIYLVTTHGIHIVDGGIQTIFNYSDRNAPPEAKQNSFSITLRKINIVIVILRQYLDYIYTCALVLIDIK